MECSIESKTTMLQGGVENISVCTIPFVTTCSDVKPMDFSWTSDGLRKDDTAQIERRRVGRFNSVHMNTMCMYQTLWFKEK